LEENNYEIHFELCPDERNTLAEREEDEYKKSEREISYLLFLVEKD
jgi:hypothetical protein